jgi:cell division protein FtsB
MNEHIINLSGQIRLLERKISSNKEEVEQSLKIATSAKESNKNMEAWKHARKAERRRQNTIKLSELLIQIKKVHVVLARMYEVSSYVIEDLEDDIQQKEIEYKTIKEAHAALKSSMSILNGNPDERAMFELALEKMEEDVSKKLGTMDRFMYMSESLLTSIDLEQGVLAENGMLMLEEFEDGAFDEFFKDFDAKDIKSKMTAPERLAFDTDLKSFNDSQTINKDASGKYFNL